MTGKDILKTLVELLERQEQIKVTYTTKDKTEESNERKFISSPAKSSGGNS